MVVVCFELIIITRVRESGGCPHTTIHRSTSGGKCPLKSAHTECWIISILVRVECLFACVLDVKYPMQANQLKERANRFRQTEQLQVTARRMQLPEARE